jgi:hypothetical protein
MRLSGPAFWPKDSQHLTAVIPECLLTFRGQAANRNGHFALEQFLNLHVPGLLQLGQVAGQVTLSEFSFALQVEKVRFADGLKKHQNLQSRWFMNDAIQLCDFPNPIVHA